MFLVRLIATLTGGPVTKDKLAEPEFDNGLAQLSLDHREADAEILEGKRVNIPPDIEGPRTLDHVPHGKPTERQYTDMKEDTAGFLARVVARFKSVAKNTNFSQAYNELKQLFPGFVQRKATPQEYVYVWNPKEPDAKLDVKKVKDTIEPKFPNLVWTFGDTGAQTAEVKFSDGTLAQLAIGEDSDHLTIHYFPNPTPVNSPA